MKTPALSIVLALFVCLSPFLHAQETPTVDPKRAAAAEDLLKAMHVEDQMAKQKENIRKMMASFLPKDLPPDTQKQALVAQDAALDAAFKALSWDSLKTDFIRIYSEVYTEEELKQLAAFYDSPIGQKFIEKMPELQAKTMEIVKDRMTTLLPAVQAAAQEAIQKSKAKPDPTEQIPLPPQQP